MRPAIIGITGRSGSGKTTLVQKLQEYLDNNDLSVHSLDDYYLDRSSQVEDSDGYYNFDLPTSFDRNGYHLNLLELIKGHDIRIQQYSYNEQKEPNIKVISSAPIIIVEGLFINYFSEIHHLINYHIFVKLAKEECFNRRMLRDTKERNYGEVEVSHRFNQHAEPAFIDYITSFEKLSDLTLINDCNYEEHPKFKELIRLLKTYIKKRGEF